jgi:hypothetical protein
MTTMTTMTTMTAANPVLEADGPASNIGFAAYVHSSAPTLFRSTPPLAAAAVLLPSTEDPSPTPSSLPSFYYLKRLCPRAFFRLTVGIRSDLRSSLASQTRPATGAGTIFLPGAFRARLEQLYGFVAISEAYYFTPDELDKAWNKKFRPFVAVNVLMVRRVE